MHNPVNRDIQQLAIAVQRTITSFKPISLGLTDGLVVTALGVLLASRATSSEHLNQLLEQIVVSTRAGFSTRNLSK